MRKAYFSAAGCCRERLGAPGVDLIAKEWFWLSPLAKRTAVPAHDTAAPAHRTAVPAHRLAALAYRTAVPAQETVAVAHEMPFQATKLLC